MRNEHRNRRELKALLEKALRLCGPRILDNVDLDRLPDLRSRAAVAARAMIDRGDARAFALAGRCSTVQMQWRTDMALSKLQSDILRVLAKNRSETSYLAGTRFPPKSLSR